MATHHCCDRFEVRRPAVGRIKKSRDLAEEVGAQNAGGDDRERPRLNITAVVEMVDGASAVDAEMIRKSISRSAAMSVIRKRHPDLYDAYQEV